MSTMAAETALRCPACGELIHVGDEVLEGEDGDTVHLACWDEVWGSVEGGE